jgi:hypothetical protein
VSQAGISTPSLDNMRSLDNTRTAENPRLPASARRDRRAVGMGRQLCLFGSDCWDIEVPRAVYRRSIVIFGK